MYDKLTIKSWVQMKMLNPDGIFDIADGVEEDAPVHPYSGEMYPVIIRSIDGDVLTGEIDGGFPSVFCKDSEEHPGGVWHVSGDKVTFSRRHIYDIRYIPDVYGERM